MVANEGPFGGVTIHCACTEGRPCDREVIVETFAPENLVSIEIEGHEIVVAITDLQQALQQQKAVTGGQ